MSEMERLVSQQAKSVRLVEELHQVYQCYAAIEGAGILLGGVNKGGKKKSLQQQQQQAVKGHPM